MRRTKNIPKSKSKQVQQAERTPKKQDLVADLKKYREKILVITRNLDGIQCTLSSTPNTEEKNTKEKSYKIQKEIFDKEKKKWISYLSLLVENTGILEIPSAKIESLFKAVRSVLFYLVKIELLLDKLDDAYATFIELERTFFGVFKDKSIIYWKETCTIKAVLYSYLAYTAAFVNADMPSSIVFLLSIPPKEKWEEFSTNELESVYEYLLNLCSRDPDLILINKVEPNFLKARGEALLGDEFYYDLKSPSAPQLGICFTQAVQRFQGKIMDLAFNFLSQYPTEVKTDNERYLMLLAVKAGLRVIRDFLKDPLSKVSQDVWLLMRESGVKMIRLFLERNRHICEGFLPKQRNQEESNSLKTNRGDEKKEEENSESIANRIKESRRNIGALGKLCFELAMICEFYERFFPEAEVATFLNLNVSTSCQNKKAEVILHKRLETCGNEKFRIKCIENIKKENSPYAKYFQAIELMQKDQRESDSIIERLLLDSAHQEFYLAYIKLGEFYFRRNNTDLSEEYYRKAEELGFEDINIRIGHSIYFINQDKSKENQAVFLWENAKDSGSVDAALLLIHYNLSKIFTVSSVSPFSFHVSHDTMESSTSEIDSLLSLKQGYILRSIGLCMETYVLDINQEYTARLHELAIFLFQLSVITAIFQSEIIEKLKTQIENLFLCFPLLAEKYVAVLNWIIAKHREKSSVPLEINQVKDEGERGARSMVEKADSFMVQPTMEAISESVISFGDAVLKETRSVSGNINMILSQMKMLLRWIVESGSGAHEHYERKRESLKKLFLDLNNSIGSLVHEMGSYDLKIIIESLSKLRINSNDPIFKSCFLHIAKIVSSLLSRLDLSSNLSAIEMMMRCLYSLSFLKETEVKNIILNALNLHLKVHLESLSFDSISKFCYTVSILIADYKKIHGESSILPAILITAVCLLQEPAIREKLKKPQKAAHLHQFILSIEFIALYLPSQMGSLMSGVHYQKQAHIVQLKVKKGQPSDMQLEIGRWLEEEQYDIQQEYLIGILPADIYASYPRGAAHPTKFIVECNGYHHYCCNKLDEEFKADRFKSMSEDDFESVHDSILEPAPADIFKLAYKQKKGELPIICISIPMYMRGKEYVMRYIQRQIAPLCEKALPQPLGMTKMRLFSPPSEGLSAEEKQSMVRSMLPQSLHC